LEIGLHSVGVPARIMQPAQKKRKWFCEQQCEQTFDKPEHLQSYNAPDFGWLP